MFCKWNDVLARFALFSCLAATSERFVACLLLDASLSGLFHRFGCPFLFFFFGNGSARANEISIPFLFCKNHFCALREREFKTGYFFRAFQTIPLVKILFA